MGVPRARKTKSATHKRRSHQALKRVSLARCKNCRAPVRPHEVCLNCGHYRGQPVLKIETVKK